MEAEGDITGGYIRGIFFNHNHQIQYGNYQIYWSGSKSTVLKHHMMIKINKLIK